MKRASAPSYDLFKTIVTVILAAILLLMLLRGCAANAAVPVPTRIVAVANVTETLPPSPVSTEATPTSDATETVVPSPLPPAVESSNTPTLIVPSPTSTSAAIGQATTDVSTPTPASPAAETPTTVPDAATPAPVESAACNTSAPSRLSVGQTARVVQRLNMRNDASITAALLQTNPTNTQVEIIGGPVCTPVEDSAYLWWQIRLADGAEGWSAETQLNSASYFLEPVQ